MSSCVMRPAVPVPITYCRSMPRSHAWLRTAGEAIGLSPTGRGDLFAPLLARARAGAGGGAGDAAAGAGALATTGAGAGAALGAGAGAAAGVGAGAAAPSL